MGSLIIDNLGINLNSLGRKYVVLGVACYILVETSVVLVEENFLIYNNNNISIILGSL